MRSLVFGFSLLSIVSLGCSSATEESASPAPAPTATTPPGSTPTEPTTPGETKPATCTPPASAAAAAVSAPGAIQVPAAITGKTSEGLEFQRYTFELDHIVKIRVDASVKDFTDTTEKTGMGFSLNYITPQNNEDGRVSAHVDPSTHDSTATSDWLYPGRYDLLMSRSTGASANTNVPIVAHAFSVTLTTIEPPAIVNACTFPDDARSATDVRAFPECNAWCKKVAACGGACRDEDCAIPAGQCEASIRKKLACEAAAGFQCISQAGATGYSIDADCKADATLCHP